jgi:hypothetical protein
MSDILSFAEARIARGLPAFHNVKPAIALLPPEGKRIGDRVRDAWGDAGTVIGMKRGLRSFLLEVQTSRGVYVIPEDAIVPLRQEP